jgi:S1-C subfamily serine protease
MRVAILFLVLCLTKPHENGARAYLGAQIKNDPAGQGVAVVEVLPNSPAAKAGLKNTDIIVKLNTVNVADGTVTTFIQAIAHHKPGDTVELLILRDGKKNKLTVTLGKTTDTRPGDPRK